MSILGRVTVLPHLPKEIERLDELARNLFWPGAQKPGSFFVN